LQKHRQTILINTANFTRVGKKFPGARASAFSFLAKCERLKVSYFVPLAMALLRLHYFGDVGTEQQLQVELHPISFYRYGKPVTRRDTKMRDATSLMMKCAATLAIGFSVAVVTLGGAPLLVSQQAGASAQQSGSVSAPGAQANESANASASVAMRPVTGELENKLDTKSARAGDPVVLKTSQKIKAADGTEIPKGSRLVGHVTEVQAHAKGQADSRMGLQFDRVELKNGQSLAIHSMIQSVQPNPEAVAAASMASDDAFGSPGGGGAVSAGAAGGARGGGVGGGVVGGATSAAGRVGSDIGSTAGGAVGTTRDLGADATGDVTRGVGGVTRETSGAVGGSASMGVHSTGIPGVMLHGDASGSASGMLSASNQNIHLDSGTQMVVGIAAAQ
jgi:hypothetical protein